MFDADTIAQMDSLGAKSGRDVRGKVWSLFQVKAPEALDALNALLVSNADHGDIAKQAHALKSMAHSAGAKRLAEVCHALESRVQAQVPQAQIERMIIEIGACLLETLQAMSVQYGGLRLAS